MKLLFKEEGFSPDIKKIIGIVDADLPWVKMRASLEIATDEIVDIIGIENYSSITVDNVPEDKKRFYELVRFAVAFKSYIIYAPTADVAMTNKGRTMRRDEYEVGAFEWQIANHDESLERFYYKHMNLLLKYMVKNNLIIELEKFKHSDLIVSGLSDFERHYGISDSYFLYLNLLPGIREFEELELYPRVGIELYENRVELKDKKLLYNYSQKAAVYYAIEWGLRHLDFQMFPKSIVRNTESSKNSKTAKYTFMPAELALVFEKDSERYMKKIENEMTSFRVVVPSENFNLPELDFDDDDKFVST